MGIGISLVMCERGIAGNDLVQVLFDIVRHVRIGVLVDGDAGGRMRYEYDARPFFYAGFLNGLADDRGNVHELVAPRRADRVFKYFIHRNVSALRRGRGGYFPTTSSG